MKKFYIWWHYAAIKSIEHRVWMYFTRCVYVKLSRSVEWDDYSKLHVQGFKNTMVFLSSYQANDRESNLLMGPLRL